MTAQQTEAPQTLLRDGRTVLIRALDEGDYAALLTFGAALPQDDLLYLENDFQNPDIIRRLVNAAAAENWRQVVALAGRHPPDCWRRLAAQRAGHRDGTGDLRRRA